MARLVKYTLLLVLLTTACKRRPLEEVLYRDARIPVRIDWSGSGINADNRPLSHEVERVTIRFYPRDGAPPFDRYLERDVTAGVIDVPVGDYSVIVFNESDDDESYWDGHVRFGGAEHYERFAARLMPYREEVLAGRFPYYLPVAQQSPVAEPLPLASWSLERFEVTRTFHTLPADALMQVVMRPLTPRIEVRVRVVNLVAARAFGCALSGFASQLYLASGSATEPATHLFRPGKRRYEEDRRDGTVCAELLSFGPVRHEQPYRLEMSVLLCSGERYPASGSLGYDVTAQVERQRAHNDGVIRIEIECALPETFGGIAVDEWRDGQYILE